MLDPELEPKGFKKFFNMSHIFKKSGNVVRAEQINSGTMKTAPVDNRDTAKILEQEKELAHIKKAQEEKEEHEKELKKKLREKFSELIKQKDEEKIIMVLKRGYQMDISGAINLMSADFKTPIIRDTLLELYNNRIRGQFEQETRDIIEKYKNHRRQDDYNDSKIYNLYASRAITIWRYIDQVEYLKDEKYALTFLNNCKEIKAVYRWKKDSPNYPDFIYHLDFFIKHIEKKHENAILNNFETELDDFSTVFNNFEKIKTVMASDMMDSIKKFNEIDLPIDAQEKIKQITDIANDISPHKLSVEQSLDFENLYKKRFPQVLEEYITISPRYREKLKDLKENPEILLIASLEEIRGKLDNIFDVVEGHKHNRQKITHQYLKTM